MKISKNNLWLENSDLGKLYIYNIIVSQNEIPILFTLKNEKDCLYLCAKFNDDIETGIEDYAISPITIDTLDRLLYSKLTVYEALLVNNKNGSKFGLITNNPEHYDSDAKINNKSGLVYINSQFLRNNYKEVLKVYSKYKLIFSYDTGNYYLSDTDMIYSLEFESFRNEDDIMESLRAEGLIKTNLTADNFENTIKELLTMYRNNEISKPECDCLYLHYIEQADKNNYGGVHPFRQMVMDKLNKGE